MKKKWVSITGTAALLAMLTSAAYAYETPKQITHVNIAQNKATEINRNEIDRLTLQVSLLENAVAAKSAKDAINKWGDAVSTRNGAYQFALFSPALKQKTDSYFIQNGWVTGTSSPWVSKYKIINEKKINPTTFSYKVEFHLATSTGSAGTESAIVTVKKINNNWFIDKTEMKNASIWERTPYIERQLFIYRTAEYAFSIPVAWDTKYRTVEKNGNLIFSYVPKNKSIPERTLFSIEKIKEETWKDGYEESLYQKLGVKNGVVYAILPVSENQYADRQNSIEYKEFEQMCLDFQLVKSTFMFIE
ncbi:hypothetical protein [Bacillus sp. S/N-304-OC-R1]|uniref:hypothetical protein n=1 Tax=Bacillus sp. S/N-304-OC-R1 TaxID=2758034 RepID=UPI001C8D4514|nr:hypothetical protein [Bacillus sp. S/N-304-OC-R1]MBY0121518.1 hypothetical protein [Bacillus sp. S/N-304-OC-R1]